MDQALLVSEQVQEARKFLRELEGSYPIATAFWLFDDDTGEWKLFVASQRFKGQGLIEGYMECSRIIRQLNNFYLTASQVNLVSLNDETICAAVNLCRDRAFQGRFRVAYSRSGMMDQADAYLIKGPRGDVEMPTGREILDKIIDHEADFFDKHGKPPSKMKLPVLMAYDLAKCGRNDLGDISGRVFKDGITVFEKAGR